MQQNRDTIDALAASLEQREDRLRKHLPPPARPPPPRPPTPPLATVRFILKLFAVVAGLMLFQDALDICFQPDAHVFVAREGGALQVGGDVWAYKSATGKKRNELLPGDAALIAPYHGARREHAVNGLGIHLALLGLSVLALRRLRQAEEAAVPVTANAAEVANSSWRK